MEDIAINTGISRQALYKYFPSRIDLLGYLLKSIDKDRTLLEKLMIEMVNGLGREILYVMGHSTFNHGN